MTVNITYLTPTGQGNVTKSETIPANSRRTFSMLQHSGISGRAAIMVQSTDPSKKIMVERSMYWNGPGRGNEHDRGVFGLLRPDYERQQRAPVFPAGAFFGGVPGMADNLGIPVNTKKAVTQYIVAS